MHQPCQKKRMGFGAGLLLLSLLLAACGGNRTETLITRESSSPESSTVQTTSLEIPTESSEPATAAPTEPILPSSEAPETTTPAPSTEETTPAEETTEASTRDYFEDKVPDYSNPENWVYPGIGEDKAADVFFVGPTVIEDGMYLQLSDKQSLKYFQLSSDQERGLYEEVCCLYAPYYRQMAAQVYKLPREEQTYWRDQAYRDVAAAFRHYLNYFDTGKPLVLAGFSQGSELLIRLMTEFFNPDTQEGQALLNRLVALYAIGAGLPETLVAEYPWMKPADGETDLGVIISFDCEFPGIEDSVLLPAGSRSLSVNPLSWTRDTAPADKSLNKGACFMSGSMIRFELHNLCGCYIEPVRGALIVTDIIREHFPTDADILPEGNLHEYDYQFFYRNLQENVKKRVAAYLEQH